MSRAFRRKCRTEYLVTASQASALADIDAAASPARRARNRLLGRMVGASRHELPSRQVPTEFAVSPSFRETRLKRCRPKLPQLTIPFSDGTLFGSAVIYGATERVADLAFGLFGLFCSKQPLVLLLLEFRFGHRICRRICRRCTFAR